MHPHTEELVFRKSSYSGARDQNCVEVADLPNAAAVRDTQNRDLGYLPFESDAWMKALMAVRSTKP